MNPLSSEQEKFLLPLTSQKPKGLVKGFWQYRGEKQRATEKDLSLYLLSSTGLAEDGTPVKIFRKWKSK